MRFVRVGLNRTTGEVQGAVEQDTPFGEGGGELTHGHFDERGAAVHHEVEMIDLGVVPDEHEWRDMSGRACNPATHIHHALIASGVKPEHFDRGEVTHVHCGLKAIIPFPCTHGNIERHLRAHGPTAVPAKVRAWLALTLPPHQVDRYGIGRGIPISVLKGAEALRNKRDPRSGSHMPRFEKHAQRHSDARAAKALAKRKGE